MAPKVKVLDYQVASVTLNEAITWCLEALQDPSPKLLVTLNPEIIVQAETKSDLKNAVQEADFIVADGIGVVWAAKQYGHELPERVPGVELITGLLERSGTDLRVFFLGAKPGTAEKAALEVNRRFGTQIAGVQHGYFDREKEGSAICQQVKDSGANLLLAGLGEGQELFLATNREHLATPLMIGVGGTLDVLSGEVSRTPVWTHKLGLEWAYRVASDPKRWHRFPRLLSFVRLVWTTK